MTPPCGVPLVVLMQNTVFHNSRLEHVINTVLNPSISNLFTQPVHDKLLRYVAIECLILAFNFSWKQETE